MSENTKTLEQRIEEYVWYYFRQLDMSYGDDNEARQKKVIGRCIGDIQKHRRLRETLEQSDTAHLMFFIQQTILYML